MVAVGLLQMHGVEFMEPCTPFVNIITVRIIFAVTVIMDIRLEQMHVVTAILYDDLDEEIFIKVPERLRKRIRQI